MYLPLPPKEVLTQGRLSFAFSILITFHFRLGDMGFHRELILSYRCNRRECFLTTSLAKELHPRNEVRGRVRKEALDAGGIAQGV
jgi:hypothetical protein